MAPGDSITVHVNQGERPATVLAVLGAVALVEYQMPKGTTALLFLTGEGEARRQTSVGYNRLPLKWLRKLVEEEAEWIGQQQQTGVRLALSPRQYLAARLEERPTRSRCCRHSHCTTYTTDPSGLCPGHRDLEWPSPTRKPHAEDYDGTEDLNDARFVKPWEFEE